MYKICKTEESVARQKLFEKGLMELMLVSRFEDISVSSLCKYVDVPRNSFYRYFSTKEDTLLALIDHTLMEASDNAISKWRGGAYLELADIENFFVFWQKKQSFLDAVVKNDRSWLLVERSVHMHEQKQAHTNILFDPENFAKEQIPYILTYSMVSILLRWHNSGYPSTPEKMAKVTYNLFSSNVVMKDVLI